MNGEGYKEVRFDQYCSKCAHKDVNDWMPPCDECLSSPIRPYSHKPEKFEEKKS